MNCEHAQQAILDSLTEALPSERRIGLDAHLASCDLCTEFARFQQTIDARLAASVPNLRLAPEFRAKVRSSLTPHERQTWSESLPDFAHLIGCGAAIALLVTLLPDYSRTIMTAGAAFTGITYFVQAVLRNSLEADEPRT